MSSILLPCRPLLERGEYRLQSEDGSITVPVSAAAGVAEAYSNAAGDPVGYVLSLGRAAVQSMQPEAAETNELTQLMTPLVLGKLCCVHPHLQHIWAYIARVVLHSHELLLSRGLLPSNRY